jgi:hypothetical protein
VEEGSFGLTRRSAVRQRRMRRLRAIAVMVLLAVIWLGYSVAVEIAAERAEQAALQAPDSPTDEAVRGRASAKPIAAPAKFTEPQASAAAEASQVVEAPQAELPGVTPQGVASPAAAAPTGAAHVPFFQAALQAASGHGPSGAHGLPGGSFGGGSMPSMSGGGGASGEEPPVTDEPLESGDGVASVLGNRFSQGSDEPSGNNGSNGSSGGSNDHNGDANGNNGSNGSNGSNDQNGDGNGNNGKNGDNGSNSNAGPNGNNASNGNDTAGNGDSTGGDENASPGLAADDEGPNGARSVPEPGSILMALGAAAALVRRHRR